jgi:predicted RNase H-like HicB family nuclease
MAINYIIVIHKDFDSDYGVTVPDLPGCFSAGNDLDQALENAKEAIECHLEGLLADNEVIPKRQSLEIHQKNQDYQDGIWAVVSVELPILSIS